MSVRIFSTIAVKSRENNKGYGRARRTFFREMFGAEKRLQFLEVDHVIYLIFAANLRKKSGI